MYTKTKIFNLALNALLLSKQITNADTDLGTEADNLRLMWDVAVEAYLSEADLNETTTSLKLVLVANEPTSKWCYAYEYPPNCAFFRRICSGEIRDTKDTLIIREIGIFNTKKVIFTNQDCAYGEIVDITNFLIGMSANSAMALAHKIAMMAMPLMAKSTNPTELSKAIQGRYDLYKSLAQQKDARENFNFATPQQESDISRVRFE